MLKLKVFFNKLFPHKTKLETFFLKTVIFQSADTKWSENYLTDVSLRLTSLLKETLKNNFWEKYSEVLVRFHFSNRLLLRVKYIENGCVCLTQVWRTAKDYDDFTREALQGHSIKNYLERMNFIISESDSEISEPEVLLLLKKLESHPNIIQFITPAWMNESMQTGDPLKKGKLYLPFQDQES